MSETEIKKWGFMTYAVFKRIINRNVLKVNKINLY
jgi:hypothetical protein